MEAERSRRLHQLKGHPTAWPVAKDDTLANPNFCFSPFSPAATPDLVSKVGFYDDDYVTSTPVTIGESACDYTWWTAHEKATDNCVRSIREAVPSTPLPAQSIGTSRTTTFCLTRPQAPGRRCSTGGRYTRCPSQHRPLAADNTATHAHLVASRRQPVCTENAPKVLALDGIDQDQFALHICYPSIPSLTHQLFDQNTLRTVSPKACAQVSLRCSTLR